MNNTSQTILMVLALLFVSSCGTESPAQAAQSLFEDFNDDMQPATLEMVLPTSTSETPIFLNGQAIFPGADLAFSRSYLRTVANDYSTVDFIAEITVSGGVQNAFFGLGIGDSDATNSFGAEPRANPHIYLLMDKDSPTNNGLIDDNGQVRVNTSGIAGAGTHRVRLTWNAQIQQAQFLVDRNFDGISFIPDFVSQTIDGSDNGFTNGSASIFFGGSTGVEFDDLTVTPVPEPSTWVLATIAVFFGFYRLPRCRKA